MITGTSDFSASAVGVFGRGEEFTRDRGGVGALRTGTSTAANGGISRFKSGASAAASLADPVDAGSVGFTCTAVAQGMLGLLRNTQPFNNKTCEISPAIERNNVAEREKGKAFA